MTSPADAERAYNVVLERMRIAEQREADLRGRFEQAAAEVERLRQREVSCRECGEPVECGDVVFHEECLDPAIIAARAAVKQGEDGSG